MHLVPADRAHRRIIDEEKVCQAIRSLDVSALREWSERFALLGDPTRLSLLRGIRAAGPISVSDLAVAVDRSPDTVSQTLRFLRANHTVRAERRGRVIRYTIADPIIDQLLSLVDTDRQDATPGPTSARVSTIGDRASIARTPRSAVRRR